MTLTEALVYAFAGKTITRPGRNNYKVLDSQKPGKPMIRDLHAIYGPNSISEGGTFLYLEDILATDWEIVTPATVLKSKAKGWLK